MIGFIVIGEGQYLGFLCASTYKQDIIMTSWVHSAFLGPGEFFTKSYNFIWHHLYFLTLASDLLEDGWDFDEIVWSDRYGT